MTQPFIPLSVPHMVGDEMDCMKKAFDSNWISHLGHEVDAFEKAFSTYLGLKGGFASHSGTAALHLAMRCLDLQPGDTVLCSTLTFVATLNPILYTGAIPVFIDAEPATWGMCPQSLKRALLDLDAAGTKPKAIVVASLYGQSADMPSIMNLADAFDIPVIEDACEALGGTFNNQKNGTFGTISAFSFSGNKLITTSAGGMLTTNDENILDKARWLGLQARDPGVPQYSHSAVGHNYRLSNVLAGIGLSQLRVIDERIQQRRAVFDRYVEGLNDIDTFNMIAEAPNSFSSRWLSVLQLTSPDMISTVMNELSAHNIESRRVFWPMHRQPIGQQYTYYTSNGDDSVSDKLYKTGLCLPSSSSLSHEDQQRVISTLRNVASAAKTPRHMVPTHPTQAHYADHYYKRTLQNRSPGCES